MNAPRVVVIYGPTASGKSALALERSERLGGEIVSVDSVQVYRGMDIGTAKPDAAMRGRVPHHLLDLIDPDATLDARSFAQKAHEAVTAILSRKKTPILAGGAGFYFTAIFEGFFEGPTGSPEIRERLRQEALIKGREVLYRRLAELDPESAKAIHPNNLHRLIRALEVIDITGEKLSHLKQKARCAPPLEIIESHYLNPARQELYALIDARASMMYENGLIDETRTLLNRFGSSAPGLQSIGYREAAEVVGGRMKMADALELTRKRTRNYAKRQVTWFSGNAGKCLREKENKD